MGQKLKFCEEKMGLEKTLVENSEMLLMRVKRKLSKKTDMNLIIGFLKTKIVEL